MKRFYSNMRLALFFGLVLGPSLSFANLAVTIEQISRSGKTLSLNKGRFDGIQDRELANLVRVFSDPDGSRSSKPIGRIQAIKVLDNQSLWFFMERQSTDFAAGEGYILLTDTDLLRGRRPLTAKRREMVGALEQEYSSLVEYSTNDANHLAKIHDARKIEDVYKNPPLIKQDLEIVDYAQWKGTDVQRPEGIYYSPYLDQFTRDINKKWSSGLTNTYASNVNNRNFEMEQFIDVGSTKDSPLSSYADYLANKDRELDEQKKYYDYIQSSGSGWSSGMSDEELSKSVSRLGRYIENKRLYDHIQRLKGQQFSVSYGQNAIANQSSSDTVAVQRYSFELNLEKFVQSKISGFRRMSFEASARKNADSAKFADTYTAQITEDSLALGMNYYWNSFPDERNKWLFYTGLHTRWGMAKVTAPTVNESLHYSIGPVAPFIKIGTKYTYSNYLGFKLALDLGSMNYIRNERKMSTELLPDKLTTTEARLSMGLTYNF